MGLKENLIKHPIPWMGEYFERFDHIVDGTSCNLDLYIDRISPDIDLLLSPFRMVSMDPHGLLPSSLKVVFMAQDPYPTPGHACGIATCCLTGEIPNTLSNMYKRAKETVDGFVVPDDGDIRGWAAQGILFINKFMTILDNKPLSHTHAWGILTETLIRWLSDTYPHLVFVFLGAQTRELRSRVDSTKHTVITTSHPSGRGYHYGFSTCDIYNEINTALSEYGMPSIDWNKKYTE